MPRSDAVASDVVRRPTLLNSCAMAATAKEAQYRIGYPFLARDSRVIALDAAADAVVCAAARRDWSGTARFFTVDATTPGDGNGSAPDAALRTCDGATSLLSTELADADVAVMVASAHGGDTAAVVGRRCVEQRVMTAGVVLTDTGEHVNEAVLALRPYAMVLVLSREEEDFLDLLTALRV